MNNSALKISGVSKKYVIGKSKDESLRGTLAGFFSKKQEKTDTFWALKDVSFDIQKGDVVGIIGKNGAGKSTLLKILSQITKPTTGSIEIDGRVAALLEVGTGFHPELTGRENVFLNGTILGMTRKEVASKFDEIVAFSGVEKFIDTPVKHYSSGMYVRLAFAVAAHLEPEILIIDEVLAVGDAEFQKKCLGKMKDVAGEGRTVIFVSHDLKAVNQLCSKAILLENGQIALKGKTDEVIDAYLKEAGSNDSLIKYNKNEKLYISNINFSKSSYQYDDEIELTVFLENVQSKKIDNLNLVLTIYDNNSNKIYHIETRYLLNMLFSNYESKDYRFKIENRLKSGVYTLELFLFEDWKVINELKVNNCFEIMPGHPYAFNQSYVFSGFIIPNATFSN